MINNEHFAQAARAFGKSLMTKHLKILKKKLYFGRGLLYTPIMKVAHLMRRKMPGQSIVQTLFEFGKVRVEFHLAVYGFMDDVDAAGNYWVILEDSSWGGRDEIRTFGTLLEAFNFVKSLDI